MKHVKLKSHPVAQDWVMLTLSHCRSNDENALEVDFRAIDFSTPHLTLSSSIGNGLNFVSKFTSSKLAGRLENAQPLVDYLLSLNHEGEVWECQEFSSVKHKN